MRVHPSHEHPTTHTTFKKSLSHTHTHTNTVDRHEYVKSIHKNGVDFSINKIKKFFYFFKKKKKKKKNSYKIWSFLLAVWLPLLCRTAVDVQLAMRIHPMGRDITERTTQLSRRFVMFSLLSREIHTHTEKERKKGRAQRTHTQVG